MRVIGVLDLKGGVAVHARRGARADYAPAGSVLLPNGEAPGNAVALARGYGEALGLEAVYVADLDAIAGGAPQHAMVREAADAFARGGGSDVLLDAAIATPGAARDALALGATRVVVGLETLPSFDALRDVADAAGGGRRTLFSLDLRDGVPLGPAAAADSPTELARRAVDAGTGGVILLDLARVGSGRGVDLALLADLRRALPDAELLSGGGVRDADDLRRLADTGCDGALVATALHEGRVGRGEIEALRLASHAPLTAALPGTPRSARSSPRPRPRSR